MTLLVPFSPMLWRSHHGHRAIVFGRTRLLEAAILLIPALLFPLTTVFSSAQPLPWLAKGLTARLRQMRTDSGRCDVGRRMSC